MGVLPRPMSSARQAPEAVALQGGQPGDADLLVGAQPADEARRLRARGSRCGPRRRSPRSVLDPALRLHRSRWGSPVSSAASGARASRSASCERATRRRPGPALEEGQRPLAPAPGRSSTHWPAHPDEGLLQPGQVLELLAGQGLVAQGDFPVEGDQRLPAERRPTPALRALVPRSPPPLRRRRRRSVRLQPRHEDAEAAGFEHQRRLAQEPVRLGGGEGARLPGAPGAGWPPRAGRGGRRGPARRGGAPGDGPAGGRGSGRWRPAGATPRRPGRAGWGRRRLQEVLQAPLLVAGLVALRARRGEAEADPERLGRVLPGPAPSRSAARPGRLGAAPGAPPPGASRRAPPTRPAATERLGTRSAWPARSPGGAGHGVRQRLHVAAQQAARARAPVRPASRRARGTRAASPPPAWPGAGGRRPRRAGAASGPGSARPPAAAWGRTAAGGPARGRSAWPRSRSGGRRPGARPAPARGRRARAAAAPPAAAS